MGSATGLNLFKGLAAAGKFGNDGIDRRSPDERLGVFVPRGEEVIDGGDEFVDAEERITADAFVGEFGEPSLDQVQPTATGGHIVNRETGMFPQPGLNLWCTVSPVVVHDDVQGLAGGKLAIDPPQKLQKLLVSVSFVKIADDLPPQQIEGSEQSSRPVALVIVRHSSAAALLEGQAGLRAVQSLNLALFINTKHDGFVGWIEIEADNIGQFFEKLRITRQLKCLRAMGLDVVAFPKIADR